MQLSHLFTNLRQGLRRHASMHAAVVLTLFVSLSLAGLGALLVQQATLIRDDIGDELTVEVFLCVGGETRFPQCTSPVTDEQRETIQAAIAANPEVESYRRITQAEQYEILRKLADPEVFEGPSPIITVATTPESLRITLKDADQYDGVVSAVSDLDGVRDIRLAKDLVDQVFRTIGALQYLAWGAAGVLLVAAVLLVGNTIRLAALARRKEIEIMRLVGASRIFIATPFLLEALFTGLLGAGLAIGTLAAFTEFGIVRGLDPAIEAIPLVGWDEFTVSSIGVLVIGPALTILPTLLLTRKYLRL